MGRFVVDAQRIICCVSHASGRQVRPANGQPDAAFSVRRLVGAMYQTPTEERNEWRNADREPRQIKQSSDAPIVFQFVNMETHDGVRKSGKIKVINKTSKDVLGYNMEVLFFNADGSIADTNSAAVSAAEGQVVLRAHSETL